MKQMMALVALLCGNASADVTTTKADGGSLTIRSVGVQVDENTYEQSTLRREWIAVHDDRLPVDVVGTPGVTITFASRGRGYEYRAEYTISASEPVVAIEVNFILFDVWGVRKGTLSATDVEDFDEGEHNLIATWRVSPESEATKYYASIGYVSAVRTKAGAIFTADTASVEGVAQEYMYRFTDGLLETDPRKE